MPVNVQRALWRDCHEANGGDETFFIDCEAPIGEATIGSVLEKFRAREELHEELSFWIGHNIAVIPNLVDQIRFGDDVIMAIDDELGK